MVFFGPKDINIKLCATAGWLCQHKPAGYAQFGSNEYRFSDTSETASSSLAELHVSLISGQFIKAPGVSVL